MFVHERNWNDFVFDNKAHAYSYMILILKEMAFLTHDVHSNDQTMSPITTVVKFKKIK